MMERAARRSGRSLPGPTVMAFRTAAAAPRRRRFPGGTTGGCAGCCIRLVLAGVVLLGAYLVSNTLANLESRNIATGFGFLQREAGFGVSESPIEYSPADSYLQVLLVGLLNTLKVSVVGVVLATLIGTIVGIARLCATGWWPASPPSTSRAAQHPGAAAAVLLVRADQRGAARPRQAFNPLPGVFLSARG